MKQIALVAIQHPDFPDLYLHGFRDDRKTWSLPSGHMEDDETARQGAARELLEETGLKLKNAKPLREEVVTKDSGKKLKLYLFSSEWDELSIPTAKNDPDEEFSHYKWLNPLTHGDMCVPVKDNILIHYLNEKKKEEDKLKKAEDDGIVKLYHMTNKSNFKLDPNFAPQDNSISLDDRSGRKGIYTANAFDLGKWKAKGYTRPFLAELHVPKSLMEHKDMGGRWAGEKFIPNHLYDQIKLHRVIPLDAHDREQWGTHGSIEEEAGSEFDTGKPISSSLFGDPYHHRGYKYTGKDIRDMSPEEIQKLKQQFVSARRSARKLGNSGFGKSELAKGVTQRLMPFQTEHVGQLKHQARTSNPRGKIESWMHGQAESRNQIPELTGTGRQRALRKLGAATKVRRNPDTGEAEFLLHRGASPTEQFGTSHTHDFTSWTPKHDVAKDFARDYQEKHNDEFVDSAKEANTMSAWIPESSIHHVPLQVGPKLESGVQLDSLGNRVYKGPTSGKLSHEGERVSQKSLGIPSYRNEFEVIVKPNHGGQYAHHTEIPTGDPIKDIKNVDDAVNARALHAADHPKYRYRSNREISNRLRNRRMGKSELKKSGPNESQDPIHRFANLKELEHHLSRNPFVMISAHHHDKSPEENQANHRSLVQDVLKRGYKITPTLGKWQGQHEPSLMVHDMTEEDATELAHKYKQYATLHSDKGTHRDVSHSPKYEAMLPAQGHEIKDDFDDNYSTVELGDGTRAKFRLNLGSKG